MISNVNKSNIIETVDSRLQDELDFQKIHLTTPTKYLKYSQASRSSPTVAALELWLSHQWYIVGQTEEENEEKLIYKCLCFADNTKRRYSIATEHVLDVFCSWRVAMNCWLQCYSIKDVKRWACKLPYDATLSHFFPC